MLKELEEIDTADVEALAAIKKEDDVVQRLIEKANASKEKVAPPIYERVMADYDARVKALDAQARPLRHKARAELGKLKALHARLARDLESAKLDLSELEFRHELGELSDEEFGKRREAAQEALTASQTNFDDAEKLHARFLEVLPPGAEPEPPPPPPPPPAPPEPEPIPEPPLVVAVEDPSSTTQFARPEPVLPPGDEFGTIAVSREEAAALTASPEPVYGTLVMPGARLVRDDDGKEGPSYVIGTLTTLGRTPDNSIALDNPEVSRKHARIQLGADGKFTLVDNNSNNGTYVNGDRISEHVLRDGDRIQVGTNYFFFRER